MRQYGLSRAGTSSRWRHRLRLAPTSTDLQFSLPLIRGVELAVGPALREQRPDDTAILLASATVATLYGRRASNPTIHGLACGLVRAVRKTNVAPTTIRERNKGLPILEMPPSRFLPPLECGRGVKPTQAAKCRPDRPSRTRDGASARRPAPARAAPFSAA